MIINSPNTYIYRMQRSSLLDELYHFHSLTPLTNVTQFNHLGLFHRMG